MIFRFTHLTYISIYAIFRLEQTYNQLEIDSYLDIFGHASSSTIRATSGNGTQVKSEFENQNPNLIEIDDSSDEEGASERAHSFSESVLQVSSQQAHAFDFVSANGLNRGYSNRLQGKISSTLAERANDVNAYHIGSTIIKRNKSNAKTEASGGERHIGSEVVEYVATTVADNNNDDAANGVRSSNSMAVDGQNGKLTENGGRDVNNVLLESDNALKENQRNTKLR